MNTTLRTFVSLCVVLVAPQLAPAAPREVTSLDHIGVDYAMFVGKTGFTKLAIQTFVGYPLAKSVGLEGLRARLRSQLAVRNVAVSNTANDSIVGEMKDDKITLSVRDSKGETVESTTRTYVLSKKDGARDQKIIEGMTAPVGVPDDDPDKNPGDFVHIDGNTVFTKRKNGEIVSEYGVEVVSKDGVAFLPTKENGYAFIDLPIEGIYRIRVHNNSDETVAARVTIDGLSMFQYVDDKFRTNGLPNFTRMMINPNSKYAIRGWYKNTEEHLAFHVTDDPDIGEKKPSKLGAISVQFFRAWKPTATKPRDAILDRSLKLAGAGKQTIPGQIGRSKTRLEKWNFEDEPRATITIRYDRPETTDGQ